jgi:hypothetical protein
VIVGEGTGEGVIVGREVRVGGTIIAVGIDWIDGVQAAMIVNNVTNVIILPFA